MITPLLKYSKDKEQFRAWIKALKDEKYASFTPIQIAIHMMIPHCLRQYDEDGETFKKSQVNAPRWLKGFRMDFVERVGMDFKLATENVTNARVADLLVTKYHGEM